MLDAEQSEQIYTQTGDEFKKATPKQDFMDLLDVIHKRLGLMKDTKQITFGINYGLGGTYVSLLYDTHYSGGEAKEHFVFRLDDQKTYLVGYHVESNALLMK